MSAIAGGGTHFSRFVTLFFIQDLSHIYVLNIFADWWGGGGCWGGALSLSKISDFFLMLPPRKKKTSVYTFTVKTCLFKANIINNARYHSILGEDITLHK